MKWWTDLKAKSKQVIDDYGSLALGTWAVVRIGEIIGWVIAIEAGFQPEGVALESGKWAAAMVVTQATKPIRLGALVIIIPLVARLVKWKKKAPNEAGAEGPETPDAAAASSE